MKWYKWCAGVFLVLVAAGGLFLANRHFAAVSEAEEAQAKEIQKPIDLSGWSLDDSGWHYQDTKGNPVSGQWLEVEGAKYYLEQNGAMATGWSQVDQKWRYMDPAGREVTGWLTDQDKWYYLNPEDGIMTTGWLNPGDGWYYMDRTGAMKTGWAEAEGQNYYFSDKGLMQTGWLADQDKWYYLTEKGSMQTGWLDLGEKRYYFRSDGVMATGLNNLENGTYFFDENGVQKSGWMTLDNNRYYFDDEGAMHTGWLEYDGQKYFMDSSGMMRKGWIFVDGRSVYMDGNGIYHPELVLPAADAGPMIALTFDDGPGKYTDRLLTALESNHVKATFFMLGNLVGSYPDTVRRMKNLGCEIGDHSYDHSNLKSLDPAGVQSQIRQTDQRLSEIIGEGATLVRPPYGSYDDKVKQNAGAPLILWSIDTLDWKTLNTQTTVDTVLNEAKDGDVILMHDIHETSVAAAETLIPELIKRGYQLVTVSEMAAAKGKALETGGAYGAIR